MQRSLTYKNSLTPLLYVAFFVIYESLSSIYLFLPPLFSVLFLFFINALDKEDSLAIFLIIFCIVIFESDKGYPIFSAVIYFVLIYRVVLPKLIQNFSCPPCIKISIVLLAYLGFYFFNSLLSNIFLTPMPSINYYIVYYIILEFLIVSIL